MHLGPLQIRHIIEALITLILSIAVHEFGHAIVADKLGDPTPASQGRVTLNPIAHADPLGTLLFPTIFLVFTGGIGFGWGRPVMVRPHLFTRKLRMRTAHMIVAAAGPAMNLIFGVLISLVWAALLKFHVLSASSPLNDALQYAVLLNFVLVFFNLIPAPPLDGGTVIEGLLPEKYVPGFQRFAVYGPFVLMAVVFIPQCAALFLDPAVGMYHFWMHLIGHLA